MPFTQNLDDLINSIAEEMKPQIEKENNQKLRKIYYSGDISPFPSKIVEIDSDQNPIDITEIDIEEGQTFPNYSTSKSSGWKFVATNINLQIK